MAVSSNGRARGAEIFLQSMIVVDLNYGPTEQVIGPANGEPSRPHDFVPYFDLRVRQLRLGDVPLKTFTRSHTNQELILAVFQEEGWPALIDDPLPPKSEIEPRKRLHDAIYALNRSLVAAAAHAQLLMEFNVAGTGEAVRWQAVAAPDQAFEPAPLSVWRAAPVSRPVARPRRCK